LARHYPVVILAFDGLCGASRRQVETRVADALCRALAIDLADLIAFAPAQQARLEGLLALHTEGQLPPGDLPELEALVAEADANEIHNARLLVAHRERLRAAPADQRHSAA
jgi:hypothetical protein